MIEHSLKIDQCDPPPVVACEDGLYRLAGTDWILLDWVENPKRASFYRELPSGDIECQVIYYDFDPNFDANAEFEKASHGKRMGDWVRIASVPPAIDQQLGLGKMLAEGDTKGFSKVINDSDYKKLRTHRGRF